VFYFFNSTKDIKIEDRC